MTTNVIDVDKLERELALALEADRKYSRENDAKFRAVHQRVATYEEFRDIVKASHLTPLDRDDITGRKGRKQPWNTVASSSPCPVSSGGGAPDCCHDSTPGIPSNAQEFMREWKTLKDSPEEQYKFLLHVGPTHMHALFKVEISMGLLGSILGLLNQCFVSEDHQSIREMLQVLARSSRFSLSLSFLSEAEKKAAKELFVKLNSSSSACPSVNTACLHDLAKLYSIPLT